MSADIRRHVVIAIYGVGNPVAGDVERSLSATLRAVADGIPVEVREFDWNQFAPQAPRTKNRLWRYAQLFSGSFASAAWVRSSSPTMLERLRSSVDAAIHGLWAATQAVLVLLIVVGVVLYLVGASSDLFSGIVRSLTRVGVLPGGLGWRASVLANEVLALTVCEIRYGSAATVALLMLSASLAVVEAMILRSIRPLAITARRHMFVLLLVPCALLSLVIFWREERELLLDFAVSPVLWFLTAAGIALTAAVYYVFGIFFGGTRITLGWSIEIFPAILAMAFVGLILTRFLRWTGARMWRGSAKVLLDIGLYAGTRSYRDQIQEHLTQIIASIPARSSTTIWIVAHSLGSVIALDSLTNSTAWQSTDDVEPFQSVHLVTLGSPIRRFFIRFFPGAFFEPQIDAAAGTVAQRVGEFTWLNAFRRFDYIGTALGFRESGLDLPTGQAWPAHANYWGDERVVRIVVSGREQVKRIKPLTAVHAAATAPAVLTGVPEWLRILFRHVGLTSGWALGVAAAVAASWLIFPGVRELVFRPTIHVQTPAYTTARVRHDRGFSGNEYPIPIRFHEFSFDFRDEVTGREHHLSASVPGFFRLWSDPRFDYAALARFVRADCSAERAAKFYEFGWSVPCSRDGLRIAYDRLDPSRFFVIGFEDKPGYFVRGGRVAWKAVVVAVAISICLGIGYKVPNLWQSLWDLFVGEQEMSKMLDLA